MMSDWMRRSRGWRSEEVKRKRLDDENRSSWCWNWQVRCQGSRSPALLVLRNSQPSRPRYHHYLWVIDGWPINLHLSSIFTVDRAVQAQYKPIHRPRGRPAAMSTVSL